MRKPLPPKNANDTQETEKAPFLVVRRIREGILDEDFKPGDHLGEIDLAEKFEVSRSSTRHGSRTISLRRTDVLARQKERGGKVL
jgi:DNA-binding FadR family transcriptional regulator